MHQSYDYQGQILLANPTNPEDNLAQAVILITHCGEHGVRGVQINSILQEIDLDEIASNIGIPLHTGEPVYNGGGLETNKIHLVHSTDWMGPSSRLITKNLAITIDISILAAIGDQLGPSKFKACSGHWFWEHDLLDDQLKGRDPARYRWEMIPATSELVLDVPDLLIWRKGLEQAAQHRTDQWLD